MTKSTVEERLMMIMMTTLLSTAMTHHKTSGPFYHHFLSDCLVWVKSMASCYVAVGGRKKSTESETNDVYTYIMISDLKRGSRPFHPRQQLESPQVS